MLRVFPCQPPNLPLVFPPFLLLSARMIGGDVTPPRLQHPSGTLQWLNVAVPLYLPFEVLWQQRGQCFLLATSYRAPHVGGRVGEGGGSHPLPP